MNSREERELLPPPEQCRSCAHITEWNSPSGERHDCLRGHPMHPGCGWHSPKTETLTKEG